MATQPAYFSPDLHRRAVIAMLHADEISGGRDRDFLDTWKLILIWAATGPDEETADRLDVSRSRLPPGIVVCE